MRLHPFIMKTPPFKKEPEVLFNNPGEEFVFVLKGKMDLDCAKEKIGLDAGDAIQFDPAEPHRAQYAREEDSALGDRHRKITFEAISQPINHKMICPKL